MADEGETAKQVGGEDRTAQPGEKWGDPISEERRAELEDLFEQQRQWVESTQSPRNVGHSILKGQRLTGADVFCMAVLALTVTLGDRVNAERWLRAPGIPPPPRLRHLHLESAILERAQLADAYLSGAHLEHTHLMWVCLERADLSDAYLERANLSMAQLGNVKLVGAHLEGAVLTVAQLQGALLRGAKLVGADLRVTRLEGSDIKLAHLEGANLSKAHLEGVVLSDAHLERAVLNDAHLEGGYLQSAHMEETSLQRAHLEGADLAHAHLGGKVLSAEEADHIREWVADFPQTLFPANLHGAFFDTGTYFDYAELGDVRLGGIKAADVRWGGANLATLDWSTINLLGDEREARQSKAGDGKHKNKLTHLREYDRAVRANRQLAMVLRTQGLNDAADRFAYRAQVLQRTVLRLQGRRLAAAGSWLLDFISGYGYAPLRSLATYIIVILGFAIAYRLLGNQVTPPLGPLDAVVFSVTSFHGRGFSPGEVVTLHNPVTVLAAFEAILGLLIEITFIATFTQRFFAR